MSDPPFELSYLTDRLMELERELNALPGDAYLDRIEVRERIREVQAHMGGLRAESPPREDLESQLAQLELRAAELRKERIDVVGFAGGGSQGGDFGFSKDAHEMNQKIDRAQGLDEIEARIRWIKERLAEND